MGSNPIGNGLAVAEKYQIQKVVESPLASGQATTEEQRVHASFVTPKKEENSRLGTDRTIRFPGNKGTDIYVLETSGPFRYGSPVEVQNGDCPNNVSLKVPLMNSPIKGQPEKLDSYLTFGDDVEVVIVKATDAQAAPELFVRTSNAGFVKSSLDKYPNYEKVLKHMEATRTASKEVESLAKDPIKSGN